MTILPHREFLSVDDVAFYLNVSTMSVYRLIHSGDLRAYRHGRLIRVDARDIQPYLNGAQIGWELTSEGEE